MWSASGEEWGQDLVSHLFFYKNMASTPMHRCKVSSYLIRALCSTNVISAAIIRFTNCKMVGLTGSWYNRALESVSIASALSSALPFTHARSESINADSLNSHFLQLGRRSGGRPQPTVYLILSTVIHTVLAGIEPTTFRLLVRRATSCATETTKHVSLLPIKT